MKKVEKSDWTTLLIALSDNIDFASRGLINRMSLSEILKAIAQKIGFNQEEIKSSILNDADEFPSEVGNEWDELVLDDLDPEDRSEFREVKEAIDAKRLENFQEHWNIVRKSMTKRKKRGRPKMQTEEAEKKTSRRKMSMNSKWLRTFRKKRRLALENEVQDQKRPRYSSPSNVPEEMPSLAELDPNLIQDPSSEKAHQGGSSNVSRNQNEACLVADQGVSSEIASSAHHGGSSAPCAVADQGVSSEIALSSAHHGGSSASTNQDEPRAVADQAGSSEIASSSAHHGGLSNEPDRSLNSSEAPIPEVSQMVAALSQAPRSPAESLVSITSAGTNRLRSRTSNLVWQSVFCSICNCEYGQYKYDPSPGSRDSPTWDYRVADEQGLDFFALMDLEDLSAFLLIHVLPGVWPVKGNCRKRTLAQRITEDGVKSWLLANKQKCRCR